jgi:diacylglycerol kinase
MIFFVSISIEIMNTAIEATVDTISFQYNVKVKKIKDIAAGATLIISIGSTITLFLIYVPKIIDFL